MLRTIRRIPPWILITGGFLLGALLAVLGLAPAVKQVVPDGSGAAVPSTTTIQITFDRRMNAASVEGHFSTDPPMAGRFEWTQDILRFIPNEPWPAGGTVELTLRAGALGQLPLPILRTQRWRFDIGLPRVTYLWPADGSANLFAVAPGSGSQAEALTAHETGVLDYALSFDGTFVVYVLQGTDGGQEFRSLDLISRADALVYACDPRLTCSSPALSPDASWLAFVLESAHPGPGGRFVPESSQVWAVDLAGAGLAVQVSPDEHNAYAPAWSPQGWLTYHDQQLKATALMTFEGGPAPAPFTYVPNDLGAGGSWSPDGSRFVYPEIVFEEEGAGEQGGPLYYSHLFQTEISTGRNLDISPGSEAMVEDASPAFSPDGTRLVFARKYLDAERWSPGRQLWLMIVEGGGAGPLTDQPNYTFSSISWSPDSTQLAFMRRSPSDLALGPEIWWLDLADGKLALLVTGGYLPAWIP